MALSACTPQLSPPVPTPTLDNATITWLVRSDYDQELLWSKKVEEDYEKLHPNIDLVRKTASTQDYTMELMIGISSGKPPDVFSTLGVNPSVTDWMKKGYLADLTPYIQRDKWSSADFLPGLIDIYTYDGKVMGIPFQTLGTYIFYNKDVFDKAGIAYPTTDWEDISWNWDALLKMCKALTSADIYGCIADPRQGWQIQLLWGKDPFPQSAYKTGLADTAYLDDPQAVAAYQAFQDLTWKWKYSPPYGKYDSYNAKKFGLVLPSPGWIPYLSKGELANHWGLAALPYGNPGRRALVWTDPLVLSGKSAHPDAAWDFIKYLVSPQVQQDHLQATQIMPVLSSLMDEYSRLWPNMTPAQVKQVHLGALKYGVESPYHQLIGFDQIEASLIKTYEKVMKDQVSPAEALAAGNKELIEILKKVQADASE
jgi:multiple sugar transport system substrate-binding protein